MWIYVTVRVEEAIVAKIAASWRANASPMYAIDNDFYNLKPLSQNGNKQHIKLRDQSHHWTKRLTNVGGGNHQKPKRYISIWGAKAPQESSRSGPTAWTWKRECFRSRSCPTRVGASYGLMGPSRPALPP